MRHRVKNELTVRKWTKAALGNAVAWVEPKRGSTFGLPDAMVVGRGFAFMLELKVGHERNDGLVKFQFRWPQQQVMTRYCRDGLPCFYIVGIHDSWDYYIVPPAQVTGKGVFEPWGHGITLMRDPEVLWYVAIQKIEEKK